MVPEELIAKVLSGNCSTDEKEALNNWLDAADQNKELFNQFKAIWESADLQIHTDTESALEKVHLRINGTQKRSLKLSVIAFVAAACALLAVGGLFWMQSRQTNNIMAKADDNMLRQELPDGSVVWLNAHAEIEYPETFTGVKRPVFLKGEAFFEVARNEKMPFTISAGNTHITVLGTAFNVKSEAEKVTVSVTEGKVSFEENSQNVILEKGDKAVADGTEIARSKYESQNFLAWKTKQLEYKNVAVSTIIDELNTHFGTQHRLRADGLDSVKLTTSLGIESFKEAAEILALTLNAEIDSSQAEWVIIEK